MNSLQLKKSATRPAFVIAVMMAVLLPSLTARPARGEERIVPLARSDGRMVLTNLATYTPEREPAGPDTTVTGATGAPLHTLVDTISARYGVDPALTRAVIEVESSFDPRAVSSKGARGLMQLMPETGKRFGVRNFFDPAENIEGGVRYLSLLLEQFGGALDLTLAAYNAGENLVARLGRIPAIPETQGYVRKVRNAYARLKGAGRAPARTRLETPPEETPATRAPRIYRIMDEGGIVRLSNIGGP
jgi:soluble lytic murein transglycosylase-like protein